MSESEGDAKKYEESTEISIESEDSEEKIDKSLDEVSNVIHDLLTEPNEEDTDEKVEETFTEAETSTQNEAENSAEIIDESSSPDIVDEVKPDSNKFKKLTGFFKKKEHSEPEVIEEPVIEEPVVEESKQYLEEGEKIPEKVVESILEPIEVTSQYNSDKKYDFDEFIDERILISRDAFGNKEMKIKVLEVSDEKSPTAWKLGDRVKLNKILVTIKHLETQEVEEGEFDIQSIEEELAKERHYSSTNRWVPTNDIKNGYIIASRHTSLISDAVALDYITF